MRGYLLKLPETDKLAESLTTDRACADTVQQLSLSSQCVSCMG